LKAPLREMAKISLEFLEEDTEMAACPVCKMVLDEPTSGCPEGHVVCRSCYLTELAKKQQCPVCKFATEQSRLQYCRPLENCIGKLQSRCTNGWKGREGGGGGAPPPSKRAKLEPDSKVDHKDPGEEETQWCSWRGLVCDLPAHLATSCAHETLACPNAGVGCTASLVRKDAARHASEHCGFRQVACMHCRNPFEARALKEHEGGCPEAKIMCPNAGCGETLPGNGMAVHRGECGREKVTLKSKPCPLNTKP